MELPDPRGRQTGRRRETTILRDPWNEKNLTRIAAMQRGWRQPERGADRFEPQFQSGVSTGL